MGGVPAVRVVAPNGGETIAPGSSLEVSWTVTDDGTISSTDLSYIASGMNEFAEIASGVSGTTYDWTVPPENRFGLKVRVLATDNDGATGEDQSDGTFAVVTASARNYVTSSVCATCHGDKWNDLQRSGHPYKLNKVVNGQAPIYPHSSVPEPPHTLTWDQISYVIGGYGWKARFMDAEGYVLTTGVNGVPVQYNLPRNDLGNGLAAEWVDYESGQSQRLEYTCGACHTTGWQTFADNGGVHEDNLPGILGTWEETGVTCEQCHGPGGTHVATQRKADITVDRTSELCGSCHFRDANDRVPVNRPFIRHRQQYDELISTKHRTLRCTSCHDPHKGVRYGNARTGGIKTECESCHSVPAQNLNHSDGPVCIDCHMARAGKSARSVHDFEGDIRTHIFRINSDPVGRDAMFYEESGKTFSKGFVTLDFACYGCHKDPDGGAGGSARGLSLEQLSTAAKEMHP
jgi:hypothetical protein